MTIFIQSILDQFIVKSDTMQTKPFDNYNDAKKFAVEKIQTSTVFSYLDIYKNGKFLEMVS